ncbi:MAG: FixH family protein [Bacteriovoracaceae bacterium]|nr:FixH family protein [Bacteroidota bacterium]
MKVQMNWGTWIVVSFIFFAVGTFAMVYISMSTNVDLVTDDYYEKELKYQDHIDLVKGTNALEQQVGIDLTASVLRISFPRIGTRGTYSGTVEFFRPSDKRGDISSPISIDTSFIQTFPAKMFAKGLWRVKISWTVGAQNYYSELPLIVQ